jgi:hypothetical protein
MLLGNSRLAFVDQKRSSQVNGPNVYGRMERYVNDGLELAPPEKKRDGTRRGLTIAFSLRTSSSLATTPLLRLPRLLLSSAVTSDELAPVEVDGGSSPFMTRSITSPRSLTVFA